MQPEAVGRTRSVIPDIPFIRGRGSGEQRATFFELYFDLVYVFAVTQISHHLLADLSWIGAVQAAFFLVAVYWAWNYTTWMANWFDPETVPVRLVLIYVMLASFLMAVAIPEGAVDLALLFAASYVALQIGRNAFVVWVTPPGAFNENFRQILAWSILSAPLWVVGGILSGEPRWLLWVAALGLDLAAPLARYWVPRAGATPMSQWEVEGSHFAERFQLFVIIALGESIVLAGVTASGAGLRGPVVVTLGFAFLTSTALWWLYFGQIGASVARRISRSAADESGQIGRDVYTYLHLPIIAGIVLTAVGVELVIVHPGGELHTAGALVTLGGPALYLLGLMACAARIGRRPSWPQVAAVVVLLAAVPLAAHLSGLLVLIVLTVGLIALVVVDQIRPQLADSTPHP
ncbi:MULTISPECIES: low temperature requirement protein A [unclassified Frankia]|uniref:low temperature requirement protein A n=1 Tax=unclassified Frankia TaxID=2632575 RepID=UPI002AD3D353|nr:MULTISPECIES: low temperature requirement protein A [unclassified Frankia]